MIRAKLVEQLDRAAVHESGHVVVGIALGATCGGATVAMDGSGRAHIHHKIKGEPHARMLQRLASTAAGFVAEKAAHGDRFALRDFSGDAEKIRKILDAFSAPPVTGDIENHPDVRTAIMMAADVLRQNWAAVASIATHLNRHGKIDGNRARLLVAECSLGNDYLGA